MCIDAHVHLLLGIGRRMYHVSFRIHGFPLASRDATLVEWYIVPLRSFTLRVNIPIEKYIGYFQFIFYQRVESAPPMCDSLFIFSDSSSQRLGIVL